VCAGTHEGVGPQSVPQTQQGAAAALGEYLTYTLSIPERAVRSTIALAGGAAREAAALLVPRAFQSSTTYEIVVRKSLKFLCEDIGGARGPAGTADPAADYLARKAVGNFVDLAGALTLHMSPMWLLAIVSDVAYGSKAYVAELARELKDQGLIAEDSTIANMDDVLGAIQQASGCAAGMLDTPPLSVEELKISLDETRKALMSANPVHVIPQAEVARYWNEMNEIARRDGVSLIDVSSALTLHTLGKLGTITRGTLTSVKVAGGLVNRHVIAHYAESLETLRRKGFYQTVRECYEPYIDAVWQNFSPQRATWTGELVSGRLPGRILRGVRGWFGRRGSSEST
jgi:hypothetical protein